MPDAFCVQWHRPQLCESDMPSRAGFWTIFGLAVATVDADTMDCSSYYCGEISSSLTSYFDESDSHTLITDSCDEKPATQPAPPHRHHHMRARAWAHPPTHTALPALPSPAPPSPTPTHDRARARQQHPRAD